MQGAALSPQAMQPFPPLQVGRSRAHGPHRSTASSQLGTKLLARLAEVPYEADLGL